jgi:hypothetical protein
MVSIIRDKARKKGLRLTKNVKGKRVPKTDKVLKKEMEKLDDGLLKNKIRETKKTIRMCKGVLNTLTKYKAPIMIRPVNKGTVFTKPQTIFEMPKKPPPPPPKKPTAALMNQIKANIKRRGLREKANKTSITTVA